MRLHIDLWYPGVKDPKRTADHPTEVEVELVDVRAANAILIDYDFERDGYRIRMDSVLSWAADDDVCDPKPVEVAFIPAWAAGGDELE